MSGIYIHIPFCKRACHYCNFHFSTSLRLKEAMIEAIAAEIDLRHSFLEDNNLRSIYFGGGTPSLLDASDLSIIFERLSKYYTWDSTTEITLEANPDDITRKQLEVFRSFGINRLSIGIQSFHEADLTYMKRAHNASQAIGCLTLARDMGWEDITVDLIFGAPTTTDAMFEKNIQQVADMDIPHISIYGLTVEEGTALHHDIRKGKQTPLDEEKSLRQFALAMDTMDIFGYSQYEISNYCKPGHEAVHNSNYWNNVPYLGIGPAAHSYDGRSTRLWNIANNPKYIKNLNQGVHNPEEEHLSTKDQYNEYILRKLRTREGVDLGHIREHYEYYVTAFAEQVRKEISNDTMENYQQDFFRLTREGKYIADNISMHFFILEE